ncbi:Unknown protein [Striga hermonthica]|uniref:Uncharacterized protein n=1 Tax=Striga hermonthica TaxID=68872 RepID=A0A9N7MI52_STRHE|nr:Unknown protein [Striga hermonthica]
MNCRVNISDLDAAVAPRRYGLDPLLPTLGHHSMSGIRGDILDVSTPLVGGCAALPFDRYEGFDGKRWLRAPYLLVLFSIGQSVFTSSPVPADGPYSTLAFSRPGLKGEGEPYPMTHFAYFEKVRSSGFTIPVLFLSKKFFDSWETHLL